MEAFRYDYIIRDSAKNTKRSHMSLGEAGVHGSAITVPPCIPPVGAVAANCSGKNFYNFCDSCSSRLSYFFFIAVLVHTMYHARLPELCV